GALIERDGVGYLFTAKSGTGKTTHIMNWLKQYPDTIVINGDKPILRLVGDSIIGYGTPWCGKEQLNSNRAVKLKAIISLNRAEENSIERTDSIQLLPLLMQQMYRPHTPGGPKRALYMAMELAKHTELYRLGCNMNQSSAVVSYEGMNSQNSIKEEI
ncbi:MAG: hypothetical protein HUJ56_13175, partial [Erysipelotrichaceae bacterium]|nr:hypothetical protein [Erysipelotrichaceae bacterium]